MSEEKLLTVREVAAMLAVSEKDVLDLTESGVIPAYKIGGVYLRFKKDQVEQYLHHGQHKAAKKEEPETTASKIRDFLYFNDFYISAAIIIILLAYLVYRGL